MKKEIDIYMLSRINKAVLEYYSYAAPYKTEENFKIWLQGLIPAVRFRFEEQGFEKHNNSLPFMRFVLELNDIGMDRFLSSHLSTEDFEAWKNPNKNLVIPTEMNILKK